MKMKWVIMSRNVSKCFFRLYIGHIFVINQSSVLQQQYSSTHSSLVKMRTCLRFQLYSQTNNNGQQ